MGQILHGCARTTEAVRRAIQHSQASLRALARRHGVNPKTIATWRARGDVADQRTGPAERRSTALSDEDEAIVVAFRRHTLLPLDDRLYGLQPTVPHLTRSALHRCLMRHGISRLGAISKICDFTARVALFDAAHVLLTRVARWSALEAWGVPGRIPFVAALETIVFGAVRTATICSGRPAPATFAMIAAPTRFEAELTTTPFMAEPRTTACPAKATTTI